MGNNNYKRKTEKIGKQVNARSALLGGGLVLLVAMVALLAINPFGWAIFGNAGGTDVDDATVADYYSFTITDALTGDVLEGDWDVTRYIYVLDTENMDPTDVSSEPFSSYTLDDTDTTHLHTDKILKANYVNEAIRFRFSCSGYHEVDVINVVSGMNYVQMWNETSTVSFYGFSLTGNSTLNETDYEDFTFSVRANTDSYGSDLGFPGIAYDFDILEYNYTGIMFTFNVTTAKASYVNIPGCIDKIVSGSNVYVILGQTWDTESWTTYNVKFNDLYLGSEMEVNSATPFWGNPLEGTTSSLATAYA